jgi:hypothetical protein
MSPFIHSLAALVLLSATTARADSALPEGKWEGSTEIGNAFDNAAKPQKLEVRQDGITYNGKKYAFDKEVIGRAYPVASGLRAYCYAHTHLATKTKDGEIVFLTTLRTKESKSDGLGCPFTRSLKNFSSPHAFEQIVFSVQKDGTLKAKSTVVRDGLNRPELSMEEMKNPRLVDENSALKEFLAKEKPSSSEQIRLKGFRFGGVSEDTLEAVKEEPSAMQRLGDEIYKRTGDKGLVTPPANDGESGTADSR